MNYPWFELQHFARKPLSLDMGMNGFFCVYILDSLNLSNTCDKINYIKIGDFYYGRRL